MLAERPRKRLSLRMRLTVTYTVLIHVTGLGVLVAVAIVLALIPGYEFTAGPYPSGVIGTPSIDVHSKQDILKLLAIVAIPVLAILGSAGAGVSWFIAGRALKPLVEIVAIARRLDGDSLDSRIARDGPNDEVRILADTIDGMLDRLEAAFAAQSRFAANASHELERR